MAAVEKNLGRFGARSAIVQSRPSIHCILALATITLSSVGAKETTPNEDPAELIERLALSVGPAKDATRTYNKEKQDFAYAAADKLRRQGEKSHGLLLKHLTDERLSVPFEAVRYATVGHACYHILRQQIFACPDDYGYDGYWRKGADGRLYRNPYFYETNDLKPSLFGRSTLKEWLKAREGRSLRDLQIEALSWLIKREQAIGFQNENDKKQYLYSLQRQLEKIKSDKVRTKNGKVTSAGASPSP